MRTIIALGLLTLLGTGCATGGESDTESVEQAELAVRVSEYFHGGTAVFKPFTLSQNCTLTVETAGATSVTDPVLGIIMNNGATVPYGSATVPCYRQPYTATDSYVTLGFGDNITSTDYNAVASYKNPSGGAGVTVFAVGFLKQLTGSDPTFGTLNVTYTISGCNDSTKNSSVTVTENFQASGVLRTMPGFMYTIAPRPGGPQNASDTIIYELNPTINSAGSCNDDCPQFATQENNRYQSCISNNSNSYLWYFEYAWYGNGNGNTSINYDQQ